METNVIMQGIAIIAGIIGVGLFFIWLSFRIKSLKAIPFIAGVILLAWGAYLIFDFLSVLL